MRRFGMLLFAIFSVLFFFRGTICAEDKTDADAAAEILTELKEVSVKDSVVFYNGKPFTGTIRLDFLKETDFTPLERVFPTFFYRQLTATPLKKESMDLELRNGLFRSARVKANDDRDTYVLLTLLKTGGFRHATYRDHFLNVERDYNKNGILNGQFTSYHPNGKVYFFAEYRDGKISGFVRSFDQNGKLIKEAEFKDGKPVTQSPKKQNENIRKTK